MFTLNCKGRLLTIDKPIVMGIINATPDSFYAGSRHTGTDAILTQAEEMIKAGATILDIGGQSTRPGSSNISAEEELKRVIAPVAAVSKAFPSVFISIDTFYARVAKEASAAGASLVNDISAGSLDKDMIKTIAELGLPYVLMHMKGTPQDMQKDPRYEDVTREVLDFFIQQITALRKAGIHDIIFDPGFGFGKTIAHNFELLRNLAVFKMLEGPVMVGLSRKSTISITLGVTVEETLNGTTVLNTISLLNGASLLRVHDVKAAVEAVKLFVAYHGAGN